MSANLYANSGPKIENARSADSSTLRPCVSATLRPFDSSAAGGRIIRASGRCRTNPDAASHSFQPESASNASIPMGRGADSRDLSNERSRNRLRSGDHGTQVVEHAATPPEHVSCQFGVDGRNRAAIRPDRPRPLEHPSPVAAEHLMIGRRDHGQVVRLDRADRGDSPAIARVPAVFVESAHRPRSTVSVWRCRGIRGARTAGGQPPWRRGRPADRTEGH